MFYLIAVVMMGVLQHTSKILNDIKGCNKQKYVQKYFWCFLQLSFIRVQGFIMKLHGEPSEQKEEKQLLI